MVDGDAVVVIVVPVDDLLVSAKGKEGTERFVKDVGEVFPIKDLGEASYYMGCHIISRVRVRGDIRMDQHLFFETLASRHEINEESALPAVVDRHFRLSKADSPQAAEEHLEMQNVPYREAVGALLWAATMTRPEIGIAVDIVSKFSDCAGGPEHWKAVKKILK